MDVAAPIRLPSELEPYRAEIEAAARPALRLHPGAAAAGVAARYGGTPRGVVGTPWPEGSRGPLRFVGELDFAAIQRAAGTALRGVLPDDGVLALFLEREHWVAKPRHGEGWRLVFTPRATDAVPLPVPPQAAPRRRFPFGLFSSKPGSPIGPELLLGATAVVSLPASDETERRLGIPPQRDDLWEAYHEELLPSQDPWHQLLGYAQWVQSDARPGLEAMARGLPEDASRAGSEAAAIVAAADRWRLLWQIDSDGAADLMWGDAGHLYLFLTEEDLAAHRFERAWMTWECY